MRNRKMIRAVCFLLVLCVVTAAGAAALRINHLPEGCDVHTDLETAEKYPDVLFFGSSHVYTGLSPAVMYESEGIAAYLVSNSGQPIYQTQYLVEDQLKRHRPQLVVVDVFTGLWPEEALNGKEHVLVSARGIRSPLLRAKSLLEYFGFSEGIQYVLEYYYSHARYPDLTWSDWNGSTLGKGAQIVYEVGEVQRPGSETAESIAIPQQTLNALDHIIEVCRDADVELVFTLLPLADRPDAKAAAGVLQQYVQQQGGRFMEWDTPQVHEAIGLDYTTDFKDMQHLNITGQEKASRWMARTLREEFDLPDRRGQAGYESWQDSVSWWNTRPLALALPQAETLYQVTSRLAENDRSGLAVLMTVAEDAAAEDQINGGVRDNLMALGMVPEVMYQGGIFLMEKGEIVFQQAGTDVTCSRWIDGVPFTGDLENGKGDLQAGELHLHHNTDMGIVIYDLTEHKLLYSNVSYMR